MKKICFIIGQLRRGGAEQQLYKLVKSLDKNKFEPIVICLREGDYWGKKIRDLDIELIEIPRTKNFEIRRLLILIKILKKKKPDIIHTFLFSANSYGRIAGLITRVPIMIASERSIPDLGKDKSLLQILVDKLLSIFSHGIICNSKKAAMLLVHKYFYNKRKTHVVYNGIEINGLPSSANCLKEKNSQKIVGSVGSCTIAKNQKLFLEMTKIVIEKYKEKNIKFVLIGDGRLRNELENYTKKMGIEKWLVFTGERKDILNLLKSMDIFVMTSLYEGISNAIMEAMLMGLPVIATDVGGNSELVIEGTTGHLCPLNDAQALAEKVLFLLRNKIYSKRLGENGRSRIINNFNIKIMKTKIEEIYSSFY